MNISEELYDQIERFISGEMNQAEKDAFTDLLKRDNDLRAEVELHKSIERNLGDRDMNQYLDTLHSLEHKVKAEPKPNSGIWKFLLVGLSLLMIPLFLWFLKSSDQSENEKVIDDTPEQTIPKSTIPDSEETIVPSQAIEEETQNKEAQPEELEEKFKGFKIPDKVVRESESINKGFAAVDFEPNKQLEYLIGQSTRAGDLNVEFGREQEDVVLGSNKIVRFSTIATIETKQALSAEDVKVYLFNNKPSAYEDFLPLIEFKKVLNPTADGFLMNIDQQIVLNPGLYYYLIESADSEEILYVNKFEVRE